VSHDSVRHVVVQVVKQEGILGFYRGYFSTILREIPFSVIQFPLWEGLKAIIASEHGECPPLASALCGATAGGIAGALTTPLDVAKTRIMLANVNSVESQGRVPTVLRIIHSEKGIKGLFAGVVPRVILISMGGSVFFGTYEFIQKYLKEYR